MKSRAWNAKGWTPRPAKQMDGYTPKPRTPALSRHDGKARLVVPVPKAEPLRDEGYRRWVASLPCAHCGIEGYSQAAHCDLGKGLAIKASDDTCFPACGQHPTLFGMDPGCHWLLGTSGRIRRGDRRAMEQEYAAATRALWAQRGQN